MNCKNAWNREFIDDACTKTFRNGELKKHREQILFERERCLLPDAQPELARRREITRIKAERARIRDEISSLELRLNDLENEEYRLKRNPVHVKKEFIRKCPAEGCRGFLSSRWKCDVCENHICSECNEVKRVAPAPGDTEHTCDPDAVETMKMLKKDTKPCVKCGTMIHKISGCSQMWCPECHTAFDWNTGQIVTGVIHNPHFYEFQRAHGTLQRTPGDVPCGGLPDLASINRLFGSAFHRPFEEPGNTFYKVHRLTAHILYEELRREIRVSTLDLRVMYLAGNIDDDQFKQKLQQLEKRREKRRDIVNVYTMLSHTCSDILRELVAEPTPEKKKEHLRVLNELKTYVNSTFETIKKRYGGAVPYISELWEVV